MDFEFGEKIIKNSLNIIDFTYDLLQFYLMQFNFLQNYLKMD